MASSKVTLTEREIHAVAFIIKAALPDEEPSEVRSALLRALRKLEMAARTKVSA